MYVNRKMISAETIPGMGEGRYKRIMEGVNLSMIYLIYCKNFYKCYNVPPPSIIFFKKEEEEEEKELFDN
jgi:hypothetical protein